MMREKDDWKIILEEMFERMAKASNEKRGMRLSYAEIRCLEITLLGELIDKHK